MTVSVISTIAQWLAHVADLITDRPPLAAGSIGLVVGWAICPGYMYLLAIVSEWRWPRYAEQFKAFMPGDLFLGLVFGSACYLEASYRQSGAAVHLYTTQLWLWLPLVVSAVLVLALSAMDVFGAFNYYEGDTDKYHWQQLVSPTKVWHNVVVYGAYGYLLIRVGVPGLLSAPAWGWDAWDDNFARVILAVCLVRWVLYLKEDAETPMHTTAHVRVNMVQWCMGFVVVVATFVALATAL